MEVTQLAVQYLTLAGNGVLVDQTGTPFSATDYSKFKTGWSIPPRLWGQDLASQLLAHYPDIALDEVPPVIAGAPYHIAPKPAEGIAYNVWVALNRIRLAKNLKPARRIQMHYQTLPPNNYAELSAAERKRILDEVEFYVDLEPLAGVHFLATDDIRITGTAERNTAGLIAGAATKSVTCLYAAILDPTIAEEETGLEAKLNAAYPHTLEVIDRFIRDGEFILHKRGIDFILEAPGPELEVFLAAREASFLENLYGLLVNTGYNLVSRSPEGLRVLEAVMLGRGLLK
jgi:hypothetical protein